MRQKQQESLGETSGAVEIDVEKLDRYERGVEAPSEDILMLLISHFNLQDEEAIELWELAGYTRTDEVPVEAERPNHTVPNMQVTVVALDNRVLHSNFFEISTDNAGGVVVTFLQSPNAKQQPYPISRIGLTAQQAQNLAETMQRALLNQKYLSGPKALPSPDVKDNKKE